MDKCKIGVYVNIFMICMTPLLGGLIYKLALWLTIPEQGSISIGIIFGIIYIACFGIKAIHDSVYKYNQ